MVFGLFPEGTVHDEFHRRDLSGLCAERVAEYIAIFSE
jgi:hypothetical protein